MDRKRIVTGQHVDVEKVERARQLRQTMTAAEAALWQRLRTSHLGGLHFRRQQVIAGFIVDFYCHAAALVVEIDGVIHEHHKSADLERDRVLEGHGLAIIRFSNDEVAHRLDDVLGRIEHVAITRIHAMNCE